MAIRKSINFLPDVFKTDVNKKFFSATVDQLISEPNLRKIEGYIGRTFAPTYKTNDSYITEVDEDRQNYQLESSIVVRNDAQKITFFSSYSDLLNKISYYGGPINDHSRLFESEFYSYDPMINLDKFVNFSQYYWLEDGPDAVDVNTSGVEIEETYTVSRNLVTQRYDFISESGATTDSPTLARGGIYKFIVDQPGIPFWIQSERGLDGVYNNIITLSTRDVLGVTGNGTDNGEILFNVPQENAQDYYINMEQVAEVDYTFPELTYADIHNVRLGTFKENFPQFANFADLLNGKTFIFTDQQTENVPVESWTAPTVVDDDENPVTGYDEGTLIAFEDRYNVWKVIFIEDGTNDTLIRLVPDIEVATDEKVYIRYGDVSANREYYKKFDGFFYIIPPITAVQPELYYQDGISGSISGTINLVETANWQIDIENDILGQRSYTSPNGVKFTNGLRVEFGTDVLPEEYQGNTYYVEGVGTEIYLVDETLLVTPELYKRENEINYPDELFPEYITINRASLDLNPWTRNNRWFHKEIIELTSEYNNTVPVLDQDLRAQRPIIEFDKNIQLFKEGRIAKRAVDILDTQTTDAFNQIEGQSQDFEFGVPLVDGMRIIFAADEDPLVNKSIYVLTREQYEEDEFGEPTGEFYIKLRKADDGDVVKNNTVVVTDGFYKGSQWWFDGSQWNESQQKTQAQQEPLYDVFDSRGISLADYVTEGTSFAGTKIFGYKENSAGVADPVLGFPVSYKNFTTQGDIEFVNYYNDDTFVYSVGDGDDIVQNISIGLIQKFTDIDTVVNNNIWSTGAEASKQYQLISFIYDGTTSEFEIDITPEEEQTIPYVKVFLNNKALDKNTEWTLNGMIVEILSTLAVDDKIDVLVYSKEISELGFFQVPENLDLNAQNIDLDALTLGQIRNHLIALSGNSTEIKGNILATSNLRDVNIRSRGGNILQHSAPTPYASLFLLDDSANFVDGCSYAAREYTKFKNKFLELAATLTGVDPLDAPASVDLILTTINEVKNISFPWYYSDMVPYGSLKNEIEYTIFNPLTRSYEISEIFDDTTLSNKGILVYHNGLQLTKDLDYYFETDRPAIYIKDNITLEIDDIIKFVEYENTDGNFIPETPTKLGMFPKFRPSKYLDNSYREPINVIRGHDGSITPAFDDYRDDFLLELEKRIFNNIKIDRNSVPTELYYETLPGKFRDNDYTLEEFNNVLNKGFLAWVGNNRLEFSDNNTFQNSEPFTWNYNRLPDRIDGENLPGSWRSCFRYFFDTLTPNMTPWEMLGFSIEPDWWKEYYGSAPFTGGNQLLWEDLEKGYIAGEDRIDERFARPGLTSVIPVDVNGNLLSPSAILTGSFSSALTASSWESGQQGPVEAAWRASSEFPFALQSTLAILKPARFFGTMIDVSRYAKNEELNQIVDKAEGFHIRQDMIVFNGELNGDTIYRAAGYLNWIADYLTSQGVDPSTKITPLLTNYEVNLAYRMAGYSDKDLIKVFAEQSSPASTNESVLIPNENYYVHLTKSAPVNRLVYSAVILEKTNSGYSVRGYDTNRPYFTIIPSIVNSNAYKIRVLDNDATIFNDFQSVKVNVPYGTEFTTQQQVADFLVSYQRYLEGQGFTFNRFDEELAENKDWKLSVREFLYWAQQGWNPGSVLILSPIASSIDIVSENSITDKISNSQYASRILDQNFNLVKNNKYNVMRQPEETTVTITDEGSVISYAEVDLVQYEHVLIFDNVTVFNDVIYKPELGNRQFRLQIVGKKTDEWNGSLYAPGFVYQSGDVPDWKAGKDYLKGDMVLFKGKPFVALEDSIAAADFNYAEWKQLLQDEIKEGLLPNWSTLAKKPQSYYNTYGELNTLTDLEFSSGLIGFKPRQYLDDLGVNETTQIELYKGFIKQKGTANAINEITGAQFKNLQNEVSFYEDWAVRVGEYGALDINPYHEIRLDERSYSVNPALVEFVDATESDRANGVTIFGENDIYKSSNQYTGTIALNRVDSSNYSKDIPTAGYVRIDDVDTTLFNMENYTDLNDIIDDVGRGYTIWCAKDLQQDWNIFRVTETNNKVEEATNALDGYITFRMDAEHGLNVDDIFVVVDFDVDYNGFFRVNSVDSLTEVTVQTTNDNQTLTSLEGNGALYKLESVRFEYMEDARLFTPPNDWQEDEKIWVDKNIDSDLIENNNWLVYQKKNPWVFKQPLLKSDTEYASNDGFGSAVVLSNNGLIALTSAPAAESVYSFGRNSDGDFVQGTTISADTANTAAFGTSLSVTNNKLAIGAPDSNDLNGFAFIYTKDQTSSAFTRDQMLLGNLSANTDSFGSSIAYSDDANWLIVGAPGNDRAYIYGIDNTTPIETHVESVNNFNQIILSGNISLVQVGQYFIQPDSGGIVKILGPDSGNGQISSTDTITVDVLTNIVTGSGNLQIANKISEGVYGNVVEANVYPVSTTSTPVINSITLDFEPHSANVAASLSVNSALKTYLPDLEFTLSGNVVTFTELLPVGDVVIRQKPYLTLLETLQGANASGFGSVVKTTSSGEQFIVGAPYDTVSGNVNAGSAYVYDRKVEAFIASGSTDFTTTSNIGNVRRVTIDGQETTAYSVIGSNMIRLKTVPTAGKKIEIETNEITLMQQLTASDPQVDANFGTDIAVCPSSCALYISAPYYDRGTITNAGAVYKFHNEARLYGEDTGTVENPTFTIGHSIRIDNFEIVATGTSLGNLVADINNADIVGLTASDVDGYLHLETERTVNQDKIEIGTGNGTIISDAGINVFNQMQIISNPLNSPGEYFGTSVELSNLGDTLVIASEIGTTKAITEFDQDETTFDNDSTAFTSSIQLSGSAYVYELYDDPRKEAENPGRFTYIQQLDPGDLDLFDNFGSSIAIYDNQIIVGAKLDDTQATDAGSVYVFNNPTRERGWDILRYEEPKVDIDTVNRIFMYDTTSQHIISDLQVFDPAKGKILGFAEQEISYATEADPAIYNRGDNVNDNLFWSDNQVGRVWWNLDNLRFIDYEQGSTTYRSVNWGRLFPDSKVEVFEWVKSDVLPSQYTGDGTPLYDDDSAYVEVSYVDPNTNIIKSSYYYWVTGKTSYDKNNLTRNAPLETIKAFIESPKAQGVPYIGVIKNNSLITYNIDTLLTDNTVLHIDHETLKNNSIIHAEYELIQEGNPNTNVVTRLESKIIDSLAGSDEFGNLVPDPELSSADKLGILIRPRQTMFIDQQRALREYIDYVNGVLITTPVAVQTDLTGLYAESPIPLSSEYGLSVDTDIDLQYLNTLEYPTGFKVLVLEDTNEDNLWTIYELDEFDKWNLVQVQGFKASLFWDFVDWYADGYSALTKFDFVADTTVDALKLAYAPEDLIKINDAGKGQWQIVVVNDALGFDVVGIENGTIEISKNLAGGEETTLGFDNQRFDERRFDQNPGAETRKIFETVKDDIFVDELYVQRNKSIFVIMNYIFSEQPTVDWVFKTSFIDVIHKLRDLVQYPNYIKDNQTYYRDYISEVKPATTTIREYLLQYNADDLFEGGLTDFDLPAYFDQGTQIFRSPDGTKSQDQQLWATGYLGSQLINSQYPLWYEAREGEVIEVIVTSPGSGYVSEPLITLEGGGPNATGFQARAVVDFDDGSLTSIIVEKTGSGFSETPTVVINGGADEAATAYAVIKNNQVRSIETEILFDRIGYSSKVRRWTPNTNVLSGDIITYNGKCYQANADIITGETFNPDNYITYHVNNFASSNVTANYGAADRIIASYDPRDTMPQIETIEKEISIKTVTGTISFTGSFVANVGDTISQGTTSAQYLALDSSFGDMTFIGNVFSANTGSFITQPSTTSNAQAISDSLLVGVISFTDDFVATSGQYLTQGSGNAIVTSKSQNFGNIVVNGDLVASIGHSVTQPEPFGAISTITDDPIKFGVITFSGNITANIGEYITQALSGANALVTANTITDSSSVQFVEGTFNTGSGPIEVNGNPIAVFPTSVTVTSTRVPVEFNYARFNVGSGNIYLKDGVFDNGIDSVDANVIPTSATVTLSTVAVQYNDDTFTVGSGNVSINGVNSGLFPSDKTVNSQINVEYLTNNFEDMAGNVWVNGVDANIALWTSSITSATANVQYLAGEFVVDGDNVSIEGLEINAYPSATTVDSNTRIYLNTVKGIFPGMYITGSGCTLATVTNAVFDTVTGDKYIELDRPQTLPVETVLTANYDNLGQLLKGINYPGVEITGVDFDQKIGFGDNYDGATFDNVAYDSDGNAIFDERTLDTIIRSTYTDENLGIRAEDIIIDGGEYVDEYSSHAPEELIPGIVFDTLDMKIYTNVSGGANTHIAGYRIFNDMLNTPEFLRISDELSTVLVQPLLSDDIEIHVADATNLITPNPSTSTPGVIFIGAERITYYTIDRENNILGQLRRGTSGTSIFDEHPIGTKVMNASVLEDIPDLAVTGENILNATALLNSDAVTAVDGTGLDGSTTPAANFIKDKPAAYNIDNSLAIENTVNIFDELLITEDGDPIILE